MTIEGIRSLLDATYITEPEDPNRNITHCFSADMMSDVLVYAENNSVLITGLTNPQVVRTAEIKDLCAVIFSRGKNPNDTVIELARECGLCIMSTHLSTFTSCGKLYEKGIIGHE